jgi:toxin ParE1/3/4
VTRCVFSRLAEADIEAIGDHIANDNPKRALSFVRELRDRCRAMIHYPRAAPLRPELGRGVRMIVFGDYLIFYRYSKGQVIIERVLHGARNIQGLF